jgi:hypothetical protein
MTGLSDTAHAETAGHQQPSHSEGDLVLVNYEMAVATSLDDI